MSLFDKGNYRAVPSEFRTLGIVALDELSKFQKRFNIYDTDTTINSIRDAIVAEYLGFDLLNFDKHGFDAKKSTTEQYLEVKQCSFSSKSWGGTWNDTTEEKALMFSNPYLFTVIAIWKGASDLQFMIYGQHEKLGEHLHQLVTNRKEGSRSTQSISIQKLIKEFGFMVICPPDKIPANISSILVNYNSDLLNYVQPEKIKALHDI